MNQLNMWGQGYRGENLLKDALGKWDTIDMGSKTETTPWFLNYKDSRIRIKESGKPWLGGRITCVINRDYITDWSDFNLK